MVFDIVTIWQFDIYLKGNMLTYIFKGNYVYLHQRTHFCFAFGVKKCELSEARGDQLLNILHAARPQLIPEVNFLENAGQNFPDRGFLAVFL